MVYCKLSWPILQTFCKLFRSTLQTRQLFVQNLHKKVALTGKAKAYFLFHDAHQIYMMTLSLSAFFKLLA